MPELRDTSLERCDPPGPLADLFTEPDKPLPVALRVSVPVDRSCPDRAILEADSAVDRPPKPGDPLLELRALHD